MLDSGATTAGRPERAGIQVPVTDNADMTLEELYKDLHSHPELAFAEHRTAGITAEWLVGAGYTVTSGVGVAGVLRNGDGPAVLVRADMDALPLREETGLDYASDVVAADARGERTHVMHACGHDMHVSCLCGATAELAATTDTWQGTLRCSSRPRRSQRARRPCWMTACSTR